MLLLRNNKPSAFSHQPSAKAVLRGLVISASLCMSPCSSDYIIIRFSEAELGI